MTKVRAGEVDDAELAELLSPSLFAEERVVVIHSAGEAGKRPAELIAAAAESLPDGVTLVVIHSGGGRAKSLVKTLQQAGAVTYDTQPIKWPSDLMKFVKGEFDAAGVRASAKVIELVVEGVGSNLRELSAAVGQLIADTGGKVDETAVQTYYGGRPEVNGFEVADKAVTGDRAGALEALAWAEHYGVARVPLADALAEAVYGIARARTLGNLDQYALSRELGTPPFRAKKLAAQARGWDAESISAAMITVAELNADVKGRAADPAYRLAYAVARVADLRPSGRRRV